jgi:putative oxidoreductase
MMSPNRFWTLGRCPDSFELADLILSWTGDQSSPRRISVAKERPSLFRTLMATHQSFATAMLRLVLGLLFFTQSVQTMLSWFGSYGFSATMSLRGGTFSAPTEITFIAVAAEFFGGLGLIVGFLTRVVAAGIAVNAVMAILIAGRNDGFFMNWSVVHNGRRIWISSPHGGNRFLSHVARRGRCICGSGFVSICTRVLSADPRYDENSSSGKNKATQEIVISTQGRTGRQLQSVAAEAKR